MVHDWWHFDVLGNTIVYADAFLNVRSFIVGTGLALD